MDPLIQFLLDIFARLKDFTLRALNFLLGAVKALSEYTFRGLAFLFDKIKSLAGVFKQGFDALRHLKFGDIWRAIERAYRRFERALRWYQEHVTRPIEILRARIFHIYDVLFRPIIRAVDTLRVTVRLMSVFNRRLAARLDHKLLALEGKILAPITLLLKRVNELSSFGRAIITRLGLLDRQTLIASIRRDASIVWRVMVNPQGAIFSPVARPTPGTVADLQRDWIDFRKSDTGPLADAVHALDARYAETRALLK